MRLYLGWSLCLLCTLAALGQGTPPMDPADASRSPAEYAKAQFPQGTPPPPATSVFGQVTTLMKKQVNRAIDSGSYPDRSNWQPLTVKQKFHFFLDRTYSLDTFAAAAVDAAADSITGNNKHYDSGIPGYAQHYGVELGTSETNVFFQKFFFPALLKQDPRYFRDTGSPIFNRALYSISRVVITRADSGHDTVNASRIAGAAVAQSLADLYVPGSRQGLHPIANRVTLDLIRDAAFNLLHEFWPDVRRKLHNRRTPVPAGQQKTGP
jgi:hypothetical protein